MRCQANSDGARPDPDWFTAAIKFIGARRLGCQDHSLPIDVASAPFARGDLPDLAQATRAHAARPCLRRERRPKLQPNQCVVTQMPVAGQTASSAGALHARPNTSVSIERIPRQERQHETWTRLENVTVRKWLSARSVPTGSAGIFDATIFATLHFWQMRMLRHATLQAP
jgi:hypothetical protein